MVFNPAELFPLFIDANGKQIPLSKTLQALDNDEHWYQVVSPRVVETARKYFDCENIQGIPLESYEIEDPKVPSNHWSGRWMHSDLMTSDSISKKVLSEITLALFEDSGWYRARYFTGGLFRYGKKAGCTFFNTKCIINGFPSFYNEFCVYKDSGKCSANRLERGICLISEFVDYQTRVSIIPPSFQYFVNKNIGGNPLVDYCPVAIPFLGKNSYFAGSCNFGEKVFPIGMLDNISAQSSCFMSSLIPIGNKSILDFSNQKNPLCYSVSCNFADNTYTIELDNTNNISVGFQGGVYNVPGYLGTIEAPSMSLICTNKEGCNDLFDCVFKNSVSIYGASTADYPSKSNLQILTNIFTNSTNYFSLINTQVDASNDYYVFPQSEDVLYSQSYVTVYVNSIGSTVINSVYFLSGVSLMCFIISYGFIL